MTGARGLVLVAAATLVAACSDSPTATREPPADAAVATLMAFGATTGPNGSFSCPAGGEITRESTVASSIENGVATVVWDISMTHVGCRIMLDAVTLTSDGTARITGRDVRRVEGNGAGEVLESSSHQTGRMRIRTDGYDRTCDMDLTTSLDVVSNRRTITGTVCGEPVSFSL